ncbi:hypothetical protein Goarm_014321, partial [Gossypium armourianum]|nr:hypothetical protein [Gossypium armourianum]
MSIRLGSVPAVVVSSPEVAEIFLKTHDYEEFNLKEIIEELLYMVGVFNLADFVPFLGAFDLQ